MRAGRHIATHNHSATIHFAPPPFPHASFFLRFTTFLNTLVRNSSNGLSATVSWKASVRALSLSCTLVTSACFVSSSFTYAFSFDCQDRETRTRTFIQTQLLASIEQSKSCLCFAVIKSFHSRRRNKTRPWNIYHEPPQSFSSAFRCHSFLTVIPQVKLSSLCVW